MRRFRLFLLGFGLVLAALFAKAWNDTLADPVIHHVELSLPGMEPGVEPITLLLMSDIHVAGPDMPPSRLARIVQQANALKPDVVLVAGDLVSDKRTATKIYSTAQSIAPLAKVEAKLAKVAVPGNHDHWRAVTEVEAELQKAGFTVLRNGAVQVGPIAVGGEDDDFTDHEDMDLTMEAFERLSGPKILVSHSPEYEQRFPSEIALVLSGHSHCGQINYPWGGTPATLFDYTEERYACGLQRLQGTLRITSAGLGTSVLPIRFIAVPDMWLITIRPPKQTAPAAVL